MAHFRPATGLVGQTANLSHNNNNNNSKDKLNFCDINAPSSRHHIYEPNDLSYAFVFSDVQKEARPRPPSHIWNTLPAASAAPSRPYRAELNLGVGPHQDDYLCQSGPVLPPKKLNTALDGYSNLIDLSTPPDSPFRAKGTSADAKPTFHYPSPVSRRDGPSDEFALLALDEQESDDKEDAEEEEEEAEEEGEEEEEEEEEEEQEEEEEGEAPLETGSLVEIVSGGTSTLFGVVRWSGKIDAPSSRRQPVLVGVELEEEIEDGTDGSYLGRQYFHCLAGRGVFVPARHCQKDSRFDAAASRTPARSDCDSKTEMVDYGGPDCAPVMGAVAPIGQPGDVDKLSGKYRGIQGHHNSCYLDATLFSMFTFTSVFDCLLYRPATRDDIGQYDEVQRILREEIVNPLRQNCYVRSDKVMKLRRLLQKLGSVTGLTNEEKDPEEFLHCLLSQTLRAEPFLKLSSGQEAYHHQLFVEKDEKLLMPSVQQLFEQSFMASNIKLKEVPPCLIIQMPRFGKSYKMYQHVLPSSLLDITDVLENSPRQCIVCGRLADMECQQCLGQCGSGLESIAFCSACLYKVHSHSKRTTHQAQPLQVPAEFAALQEHCVIPRLYMELFAVVCIATSHYVAFVKGGPGPDAPWCFFDSMADRKGEQNGYNIPEVVPCPDLPHWLSDEWDKQGLLSGEVAMTSSVPEHARRLFSDAYMCLYQSPDLMPYR